MNTQRPVTLLLVIVLLVAGCASPSAPAEGTGQVSFMVFGDPQEKAAYDALVEAFHTKHPAIRIALIHIPGQDEYRQRLGMDFAAGTAADVVLINYRRYASFAARGVLEPLDPYLANSPVLDVGDFYQQALAPFYWENTLMCIPQNLSSLVVYYNKDLFDAAGQPYPIDDWTWEEFLQAAQALTQDTDGDGRTDQYGLGTEPSIFRVAPFIWQNGGLLVDTPVRPRRLMLDMPASRAAIEWFVNLQVRYGVVPGAVEEESESSESRFLNGRMGMYLNSRRGVPTYREIDGFDWDVVPLPRNKQRAGILHSDAYCMAASTADKAAAWTFIEYANSPEGQAIVAQSGRTVP
ncbi:MAG: sugar ABC transporter substrate-binding protein, partial [Chloroflexaceae bacterium]|nr:sugar ABC transporter substrate-binding protein [Chloroflexaceae bacterium]